MLPSSSGGSADWHDDFLVEPGGFASLGFRRVEGQTHVTLSETPNGWAGIDSSDRVVTLTRLCTMAYDYTTQQWCRFETQASSADVDTFFEFANSATEMPAPAGSSGSGGCFRAAAVEAPTGSSGSRDSRGSIRGAAVDPPAGSSGATRGGSSGSSPPTTAEWTMLHGTSAWLGPDPSDPAAARTYVDGDENDPLVGKYFDC